ncbi:MAG: cation transporter [Chitinophagaceae bacterium]|nr:cation transporter [Chitinophagaceae bacterium]
MKNNTIRYQKLLVIVSVLLFVLKLVAWLLTHSVAILTDAIESTVNVIAAFLGLYSVILSAKPKDKEHPYGHGKVEFITSAIEGILISLAGMIIIYEAINNLRYPHQLKHLDIGLLLIATTAVVNYVVGYFCVKEGRKQNSPVLIGGGEHLKSDTYSTLGLILGILAVWFTGNLKLDSAVAIVFALFIVYTGYKIIRKSVSGMMDEADQSIIAEIVTLMNGHAKTSWIDVHNLRVIDYAGFYHIDCHVTVPYYLNVNEAHQIVDEISHSFRSHFKDRVEFFIHVDACLPFQCALCLNEDCTFRKHAFVQRIKYTVENIQSNEKHQLITSKML